jgi:hypothetical protein
MYGIGLYCQINQRLWINGLSPAHWFIFSFNYSILHSICWNHKMETTEIMCKKFNFIFQIQRFCIQQNKKTTPELNLGLKIYCWVFLQLYYSEKKTTNQVNWNTLNTQPNLNYQSHFFLQFQWIQCRTLSWVEAETMP